MSASDPPKGRPISSESKLEQGNKVYLLANKNKAINEALQNYANYWDQAHQPENDSKLNAIKEIQKLKELDNLTNRTLTHSLSNLYQNIDLNKENQSKQKDIIDNSLLSLSFILLQFVSSLPSSELIPCTDEAANFRKQSIRHLKQIIKKIELFKNEGRFKREKLNLIYRILKIIKSFLQTKEEKANFEEDLDQIYNAGSSIACSIVSKDPIKFATSGIKAITGLLQYLKRKSQGYAYGCAKDVMQQIYSIYKYQQYTANVYRMHSKKKACSAVLAAIQYFNLASMKNSDYKKMKDGEQRTKQESQQRLIEFKMENALGLFNYRKDQLKTAKNKHKDVVMLLEQIIHIPLKQKSNGDEKILLKSQVEFFFKIIESLRGQEEKEVESGNEESKYPEYTEPTVVEKLIDNSLIIDRLIFKKLITGQWMNQNIFVPTSFGKTTALKYIENFINLPITFADDYKNWKGHFMRYQSPYIQRFRLTKAVYIDLKYALPTAVADAASKLKKLIKQNPDRYKEVTDDNFHQASVISQSLNYIKKNLAKHDVLLIDQFDQCVKKQQNHEYLDEFGDFVSMFIDGCEVNVFTAGLMPIRYLRTTILKIQQCSMSQNKLLQDFSPKFNKLNCKGDILSIFGYELKKVVKAYKKQLKDFSQEFDLSQNQTYYMLKSCFDGFRPISAMETSINPSIYEILKSANAKQKIPLVTYDKMPKYVNPEKSDYIRGLRDDQGDTELNDVLCVAGYYKGPIDEKNSITSTQITNREMRIGVIGRDMIYMTRDLGVKLPNIVLQQFLTLQEQCSMNQKNISSRYILDPLDVWWLLNFRETATEGPIIYRPFVKFLAGIKYYVIEYAEILKQVYSRARNILIKKEIYTQEVMYYMHLCQNRLTQLRSRYEHQSKKNIFDAPNNRNKSERNNKMLIKQLRVRPLFFIVHRLDKVQQHMEQMGKDTKNFQEDDYKEVYKKIIEEENEKHIEPQKQTLDDKNSQVQNFKVDSEMDQGVDDIFFDDEWEVKVAYEQQQHAPSNWTENPTEEQELKHSFYEKLPEKKNLPSEYDSMKNQEQILDGILKQCIDEKKKFPTLTFSFTNELPIFVRHHLFDKSLQKISHLKPSNLIQN